MLGISINPQPPTHFFQANIGASGGLFSNPKRGVFKAFYPFFWCNFLLFSLPFVNPPPTPSFIFFPIISSPPPRVYCIICIPGFAFMIAYLVWQYWQLSPLSQFTGSPHSSALFTEGHGVDLYIWMAEWMNVWMYGWLNSGDRQFRGEQGCAVFTEGHRVDLSG